jgi:hypothetical protein
MNGKKVKSKNIKNNALSLHCMAGEESKEKGKEKDMLQEYDKMRAKHGLPQFNDLDREFAIGILEPGNFVLRSVSMKIAERFGYVMKMLGDLIQPENHLSDMREADSLSEVEKRKVMELFRKLSFFDKEFLIRDFDYDEAKSAELIKLFFSEWPQYKQEFLQIVSSIRDNWKGKERASEEYGGYFG